MIGRTFSLSYSKWADQISLPPEEPVGYGERVPIGVRGHTWHHYSVWLNSCQSWSGVLVLSIIPWDFFLIFQVHNRLHHQKCPGSGNLGLESWMNLGNSLFATQYAFIFINIDWKLWITPFLVTLSIFSVTETSYLEYCAMSTYLYIVPVLSDTIYHSVWCSILAWANDTNKKNRCIHRAFLDWQIEQLEWDVILSSEFWLPRWKESTIRWKHVVPQKSPLHCITFN